MEVFFHTELSWLIARVGQLAYCRSNLLKLLMLGDTVDASEVRRLLPVDMENGTLIFFIGVSYTRGG